MRRSSTLAVGAIALLVTLAAVIAVRPPRSPADGPERTEAVSSVDAQWGRAATAVERIERGRPVLLATAALGALLLAVGWARTLHLPPVLQPVRVDRRRAMPVRGPPAGRRLPR